METKTIKELLADVEKEIELWKSEELVNSFLSEKKGILDATASFRAMLDNLQKKFYRAYYRGIIEELKAELPDEVKDE